MTSQRHEEELFFDCFGPSKRWWVCLSSHVLTPLRWVCFIAMVVHHQPHTLSWILLMYWC